MSHVVVQIKKGQSLTTNNDQYLFQPVSSVVYSVENHPADSRVNIDDSGKVQTLTSRMGTGGGNVPMVMEPFCKAGRARSADDATTWKPGKVANTLNTFDTGEARANELVVAHPTVYCLQGSMIGRSDKNGPQGSGINTDVAFTQNDTDRPAVVYVDTAHADDVIRVDDVVDPLQARDYKGGKLVQLHYIVRRLTPTECARLQGFADQHGHIKKKDKLTQEEYRFWMEVRNTHATINGKKVQEYTEKQMLTWYNKLWTDSAEYKMWGNGIALPPALYCMQGIVEAIKPTGKEEDEKCGR